MTEEEVTVTLDAIEGLWNGIIPPGIWLRRLPPSQHTGWDEVQIRGPREEVRRYVELHWGENALEDLTEGGEL